LFDAVLFCDVPAQRFHLQVLYNSAHAACTLHLCVAKPVLPLFAFLCCWRHGCCTALPPLDLRQAHVASGSPKRHFTRSHTLRQGRRGVPKPQGSSSSQQVRAALS
jgi:hypothetical protein